MKTVSKYIAIGAILLGVSSCKDFLEKNATNRTYVENINDINELILGEGYMSAKMPVFTSMPIQTNAVGGYIHIMDDDAAMTNKSSNTSYYRWGNALGPYHFWVQNPFINHLDPCAEYENTSWGALYKYINAMNVILYELDSKFSGEQNYASYKGEALFLRGLYYYFLVNLYGLPYRTTTASTDPGVPVKLSEIVEDKLYARNSVEEVYKTIVTDLNESVRLLEGVKQTSIYRPNQIAARMLLSRVYLYMNRWEECAAQCKEILGSPDYSLINFNTLDTKDNRISADSPETIFSNGMYRILSIFRSYNANTGGASSTGGGGSYYVASQSLIDTFDPNNDSRFNIFEYVQNKYTPKHGGYYPTFKFLSNANGNISDFCLFRLPEAYLNRAEALAMLGGAANEQEAARVLTQLRSKRFKADFNYTVNSTGKALIDEIRAERRRELCFEGHRWFDLRRYAVCEKYPLDQPIRHMIDDMPTNGTDGTPDGYYELPKYSESPMGGGWVLPIPPKEILLNEPALIDNKRPILEKQTNLD